VAIKVTDDQKQEFNKPKGSPPLRELAFERNFQTVSFDPSGKFIHTVPDKYVPSTLGYYSEYKGQSKFA